MSSNSDSKSYENHPSLIGVIPPALRFSDQEVSRNIPQSFAGFVFDLESFISKFDHKGEYHNVDHFEDVYKRFIRNLKTLQMQYPGEVSENDYFLAFAFGYGHDCVHNSYGKKQPPFDMTIESICELYGFDVSDKELVDHVVASINEGITQDNLINGLNRASVTQIDSPIALSEEEMSAIVVDAIAWRNGIDIDIRCQIAGMIQASEFRRSMVDGKPGFKWPRNQIELLAKLADLGNYCEEIEVWNTSSALVNTELPSFSGTTAMEFVEEELKFLNDYIKPVLDEENRPKTIDFNGSTIPARVPPEYFEALIEKETYLHSLKQEINAWILHDEPKPPLSDQLRSFIQTIRPALAKTNPDLVDTNNEISLATPEYISELLSTPTNDLALN